MEVLNVCPNFKNSWFCPFKVILWLKTLQLLGLDFPSGPPCLPFAASLYSVEVFQLPLCPLPLWSVGGTCCSISSSG